MNRQVLIGVIVVLIIAFAVGYLGYNKVFKQSMSASSEIANNSNSTAPDISSSQGSLKDLLKRKNVTCQFSYPEQQGKGNVFVGDDKVRVDSTMKIEGKDMATHMIHDGQFFYMWTDGVNQGSKLKINLQEAQASASANAEAAKNLDQKVDYECSDWSVESSKFSLPANVKFSDFSSIIAPQGSGISTGLNASLCDQISDPQGKKACLDALDR